MRILQCYGHSGSNGVTAVITDSGRWLSARGHAMHILCRTDSCLATEPRAVCYRYLAGWHRPGLRRLLQRTLREERIDVLHVHSQRDADFALEVGRALGIPTVYTCHEWSRAAAGPSTGADAVIAVSAGVGAFLGEEYGLAAPRLHVIPNGIDLSLLPTPARAEWRRQNGWTDDDVWVGFFGRVVKNKNVHGLVEALAEAAARAPRLRLLIIGAGSDEGRVRRRLAQLSLNDRVHWAGWLARAQAYPLVGALDALALPSLGAEGLSTSLLAAMALGVPVLASDLPSLRGGPVRDGDTGWLCDPHIPGALADALVAFAQRPAAARLRAGGAARREIEAHYRMDDAIARLEAVYRGATSA